MRLPKTAGDEQRLELWQAEGDAGLLQAVKAQQAGSSNRLAVRIKWDGQWYEGSVERSNGGSA